MQGAAAEALLCAASALEALRARRPIGKKSRIVAGIRQSRSDKGFIDKVVVRPASTTALESTPVNHVDIRGPAGVP